MTIETLLGIILKYPDVLLSRDSIIDMFVEAPLMTAEDANNLKMIRAGKLISNGSKVLVATPNDNGFTFEETDISIGFKLSFYDTFTLKSGMIANYDDKPTKTTFGLFILNYNILASVFSSVISYINQPWKISKIEDQIAREIVKGTIEPYQVYKYIDSIYHISSYADFCVPSLTEKAITANTEVSNLRNELHEKYKDKLNDPNIMLKIDNELIALDKAKLVGDDSNGFMIDGKNYDVHRKRMFLNIGLIESFGDESSSFKFAKTNLNDGWKADEVSILANDIRLGVYNRSKNTAKGGVESKYLGRTFQESIISEDDCKSPNGLNVHLTKENIDRYLYRTIIDNKKLVVLNEDNVAKYYDKEVIIRSPMYCNAKNGYCYTCMDSRFRNLNIKLLNTIPAGIGSRFLTISMKSMHGKKIDSFELSDLNEFLI